MLRKILFIICATLLMSYLNSNGEYEGIDAEISKIIANYFGVQIGKEFLNC